MKLRILLLCMCVVAIASRADAIDWLHARSKYTHDPQTGQRVAQFAPVDPIYVQVRPDYLKSGFRYNRSTLRGASGSAEYVHTVEQWGRPVRPYGEWKFPYRPYSVPYSSWGQPYGGLGGNYGNGAPYGGNGFGPGVGPGVGPGGGRPPGGNGSDVHAGKRRPHDDFWIRDPRTFEDLNPRLLHKNHRPPVGPAPGIDAGGAAGGT